MSPGSRFMLLSVTLIVKAFWILCLVVNSCLYDCSLCPLDRVVCLHQMYCNAVVSVPVMYRSFVFLVLRVCPVSPMWWKPHSHRILYTTPFISSLSGCLLTLISCCLNVICVLKIVLILKYL